MRRKMKSNVEHVQPFGSLGTDRQAEVAVQAQGCGSGRSGLTRRRHGAATRIPSSYTPEQRRASRGGALAATWTVLGLLLAGLLWSYWPTLSDLVAFWRRNSDYSAGALVPLVAAYVIWSQRNVLRDAAVQTCWAGLALLLAAQAMRFFGMLYMYGSLERLSLLVSVVAGCLLVFGRRITWQLGPVLAFLVLMFPLPARVHEALALPLQGFATRSAVVGLEMLGYLVKRDGNVLCLSDQTPVAVAEACSGLRMLTAFVVVAAALTFVVRRPIWQKVIIIASSIPVAILANTLRLVATVLVLELIGSGAGERFFHGSAGIVMVPFAWAVLVGELWLLKWVGGTSPRPAAVQATQVAIGNGNPRGNPVSGGARQFVRAGLWHMLCRPAVVATVAVMVMAGVGHRVLAARIDAALGQSLAPRWPLATLPLQIDDWQGRDVLLDENVRRIAGDDDFVNRQYVNGTSGRTIGLYVGYMGRPRSHMAHRPDVCYPAHGLHEESRQLVSVPVQNGAAVPGLLYEFAGPQAGGVRDLVLVTYVINGRYVNDVAAANDVNSRGIGLGAARQAAYVARIQLSMRATGDHVADMAVLCDLAARLYQPVVGMMPNLGEG
jgi:exosortase